MANAENTQLNTILVTGSGGLSEVSQLSALAIGIFPAENVEVSQFDVFIPLQVTVVAEVAQLTTLVVAQGRIDDPSVRVWAFSMDGHDFYVITLGAEETLVYDLTTGQWSEWASPDLPVWRAHRGINWQGMQDFTRVHHSSNVVAGDDSRGVLWTLEPDQGYDETPVTEEIDPFERIAIGGVPGNMRERTPVGAVYLTGSMANTQVTGAGITLYTSDDSGNTWDDQGTIDIDVGNYDQEWSWRSLGLIRAPGKLFKFVDSGASVRLDKLEMR